MFGRRNKKIITDKLGLNNIRQSLKTHPTSVLLSEIIVCTILSASIAPIIFCDADPITNTTSVGSDLHSIVKQSIIITLHSNLFFNGNLL